MRDFVITWGEGGNLINILSCIILIIENFYFNRKNACFQKLYRELKKLILLWLENYYNDDDKDDREN